MHPVLIGYFPKRITHKLDWAPRADITIPFSVSECALPGPDGWIDAWRHNALWVYSDEDSAWSVVPGGCANRDFGLFAYAMFPLEFTEDGQRPFDILVGSVEPLTSAYRARGYDVVARSTGNTFECSPLWCNLFCQEVAVNPYCLLDDAGAALELAARLARPKSGAEPGPYYVVEVWERCGDSSGDG